MAACLKFTLSDEQQSVAEAYTASFTVCLQGEAGLLCWTITNGIFHFRFVCGLSFRFSGTNAQVCN